MASGVDKTKIKPKLKHEWIAWAPEEKARYRKRNGLNYETWAARLERLQALANAAAPRGDRANND